MSLTKDDLRQITSIIKETFDTYGRQIIREEFDSYGRQATREEVTSVLSSQILPRLESIEDRLTALDNDVKEIYSMISKLQRLTRQAAHFEKYDLEQKVISAYKDLLAIANEAGIRLPNS